jgi:chromosome segregation ATPase
MCKSIKLILLSALFALFLGLASVSGQSTTQSTGTQTQESSQPNQSLMTTATSCRDDSTTLVSRLETRQSQAKAQVKNWQIIVDSLTKEKETAKSESTELSAKLAKAEAELLKSQTDLTEISKLLDDSKSDVTNLSKDFDDYKQANEAKIAKQAIEIKVYKGVAIGVTIVGAIGCGYLGGKIAGLW